MRDQHQISAAPGANSEGDQTVLLSERAGQHGMRIAIATLNAPKTLHALNLGMIRQLDAALRRWALDPQIACVVLQATGEKAFCAGGDVRSLREAILSAAQGVSGAAFDAALVSEPQGASIGALLNPPMDATPETAAHSGRTLVADVPAPLAQAFFSEEYRLDYLIHTYPKPVLVWGSGIVMGGGLGLLAGASHRVVTDSTRIAMPEISIGLFPDVGASWFLPRMPGRCGLFLGLTGAPLNAQDALFTGLADYVLAHEQQGRVLDALGEANWRDGVGADAVLDRILCRFGTSSGRMADSAAATDSAESKVMRHFDSIQRMTAPRTLAGVMAAISAYDGASPWLQRAAQSLAAGAPSSLALVWALQVRARHLGLADVFRLELIVALRCCQYGDFAEGVRALLVDKDNAPRWQACGLAHMDAVALARWSAPFFAAPWPQHPLAGLEAARFHPADGE